MTVENSHKSKINRYTVSCGVASFGASFIANLLHPFEVLKTRLQSHDGKPIMNLVPKYKGMASAFSDILHTEGLRGLYKGFLFSFLSSSLSNALFFSIYERRKLSYQRNSSFGGQFKGVTLASMEAAVICTVISQPVWVIKTRMLLNIDPGIKGTRNFAKAVTQIYQQHGVRGYFRGLGLNLVLSVNGMVQMQTYEGVLKAYKAYSLPQSDYLQKSFLAGGLSKIVSAFVSYPLTTVRTRVQQNQYFPGSDTPKYKGSLDVMVRIWEEEGVGGFYKGMMANLTKGVLQRGVYFYCYELLKLYIQVDRFSN